MIHDCFEKMLEEKREALKATDSDENLYENQAFGMFIKILLTLILPTPKVISFCHQYRARPACTSVQSDQSLYCWLIIFKF